MYISSIHIRGYRNFKDNIISFHEGINVIIGHNNAGKTNLLKSLGLVLNLNSSKRLDIDDFNKHITLDELKNAPPKVQIYLCINESENEDLSSDDLVTVSNWLIKLESPYKAQLSYKYFLPSTELDDYFSAIQIATDLRSAWKIIKDNFLRKYIHKIYGGDPTLKSLADNESISKFDFQFLNAIRDVERDMFTGKNTLLRDIVDFFIDYDIKHDSKTMDEKQQLLRNKKDIFADNAFNLINLLQQRMHAGEQQILSYAKDTGASFNDSFPSFDGSISESELYSALRLIIKLKTGIEIPATHNGLGYNNLIYISLLLAKMQVDATGEYFGSNAKVFPLLIIEEPEAHLHPSLQYKFLKFLKANVKQNARQVFISTHSTQITSAVSLDEIICLSEDSGDISVGYPAKVFSDSEEDKKSKAFVQRFLDATRSDMLFAKKVVFVEGIAEQLLINTLAKYIGISLEDHHISVINIGGRYFDHFIRLFDTTKPYSINKKVACITDRDPQFKKPGVNEKFVACYPFEVDLDPNYQYEEHSSKYMTFYQDHVNVRFFSQDEKFGKTFEYELAFCNPSSSLIITESVSNELELKKIIDAIIRGENIQEIIDANILRSSNENKRLIESLINASDGWDDISKTKALFAARYLNSVSKGENALELVVALEDNLEKKEQEFTVPEYIKDAITWICA